MNRDRSQTVILAFALAASVALHLAIIVPMLVAGMSGGADALTIAQSETDDAVTLGLDDSKQSTLDWVGYEEYEEHLAQFSETNQPELSTESPAGASPSEAAELETTIEPEQPMTEQAEVAEEMMEPQPAEQPSEVEPMEIIEKEEILIESPREIAESIPEPSEVEFDPSESIAAPEPIQIPIAIEPESREVEMLMVVDAPLQLASMFAPLVSNRSVTSLALTSQKNPRQQLVENVAKATPSKPPSRSSVASTTGQPTEQPSEVPTEQSEKETDATSTFKVTRDQWQQGKPLAAEGLELIPQKPAFTTLTLITALPRNPTGRIVIDHTGKVTHAEIIVSSSDSTVDRNITDALYGWFARGQRIDAMKDEETLELDINFILLK